MRNVLDLLADHLEGDVELYSARADWLPVKARAPYNVAMQHTPSKIIVYASARTSHFLVESGGQACDWLNEKGILLGTLALVYDRVTRLDIATDIATPTTPLDFVAERKVNRMKSHSEFVSASGTTCYIGSRTSDWYSRVYRYNEPHPRAALLRVEVVFKGARAKSASLALLENDAEVIALEAGRQFGWMHACWNNEIQPEVEINPNRPERKKGKTEFWLYDTVAPLLVRLQNEHGFDVKRWFDEAVLTHLDLFDTV